MTIQHQIIGKRGAFVVEENGEELAVMVYALAGEATLIIEHTEVSEKLANKGVGKQLVAAVDYAREQNFKIRPLCPFAKSVIASVKAYHDLVV